MTRKETTEFLSNLLVENRLNQRGLYYSKEVSIDYGTKDVKRIDFLQFKPQGVVCISEIEKGDFIVYEVKSCKEDFNSGYGTNFIGDKNYIVCSMSTYKDIVNDVPHGIGVICPIPHSLDIQGSEGVHLEFENPTELTNEIKWNLKIVRQGIKQYRKKSMVELLFCMLRSGR